MEPNKKEHVNYESVEPKNNSAPLFENRTQVEMDTLFNLGRDVTLTASYKGSKTIRVPKWSMRKTYSCSEGIAKIIATLFPNDLLFLYQIDYSKRADAASKIHKILMYDIYEPVLQIICITLDIKAEEVELFLDSITDEDFLEIFCVIVEQQITDPVIEGIIKKAQRLLADRFPLQNVSVGLADIVAEAQKMS